MGRVQVGARLWLAATVLLASGCQGPATRGNAAGAGQASSGPGEGFVYVAQLAPLHPLYPELVRLDEMIARLRGATPEGVEAARGLPDWARPESLGPGPVFVWPSDPWEHRRSGTGGGTLAPDDASLPEDLQAGLAWRQRQALREMEEELAQARSAKSRELSEQAVRWTLEAQEKLAGAPSGDGAQTAETIRADLEARVEALRGAHDDYLRALELARREVMEGQVTAAREAAERTARQRRRAPAGLAGDELANSVRETLQPLDTSDWPAGVDAGLPTVELPVPAGPDAASADAAAWTAQRDAAVERLVDLRAALQERILVATRLGAERVARRQGLRLDFGPQAQQGSDFTEQVGNALLGLWSKESSAGS